MAVTETQQTPVLKKPSKKQLAALKQILNRRCRQLYQEQMSSEGPNNGPPGTSEDMSLSLAYKLRKLKILESLIAATD